MLHILTNRHQVIDPCLGRDQVGVVELDMGCGKGGFALQLAERHPDRLVLAADLMLGRLRRLQRKVDRRGLTNLELLRASNLELADRQLPPGCIDRVHLLCPDPWPKARHRGKRLVTAGFMARVFRILRPGGIFHFSSDDIDYCRMVEDLLRALSWFDLWPQGIADILDVETDFERLWKGQGRAVQHLSYRRRKRRANS